MVKLYYKFFDKFLLFFSLIIVCSQVDAKPNKYQYVFDKPIRHDREKILRQKLASVATKHDINFDNLVSRTDYLTWHEMDLFAQKLSQLVESRGASDNSLKNGIDQAFDEIERLKSGELTTQQELALTAYHEAGHAIATIITGLPCVIHSVTVKESHSALGSVSSTCQINRPHREKYQNQIIMLLAGETAAQRLSAHQGTGFLDLLSRRGVRDDIEKALDAAGKLMQLEASLDEDAYDRISHVKDRPSLFEVEKFKILESLYPHTVHFVDQHASTIRKIGDELVKKQTLPGSRIVELVGKK